MKRLICLFLFASAFSYNVQAQTLAKGNVMLDAGFGFPEGSTLLELYGEYGVIDNLGVGARFLMGTESGSTPAIGVQGNYHLSSAFQMKNEKLDPIVGLSFSKVMVSGSDIFTQIHLGFRYLFTDKLGGVVRYNIGIGDAASGFNYLGLGITYKISK